MPKTKNNTEISQEQLNKNMLNAADHDNLDEVKKWISVGADINAFVDPSCEQPLHHEVHMQVVNGKCSAIHFAAASRNIEMIEFLKEKGANLNAQEQEGYTALHIAMHDEGDIETFKKLLELGAEIEIRDMFKKTPLHQACEWGLAEYVSALLENGADVNVLSDQYRKLTPLVSAMQARRVDHNTKKEIVKMLLEHDADPNMAVSQFTPIFSCRDKMVDVAKLLISHKANVNAVNANGTSPLMAFAQDGYKNLVELLLNHGADKSLINNKGKTAMDIAVEMVENAQDDNKMTDMKIVELLEADYPSMAELENGVSGLEVSGNDASEVDSH